MSDNIRVKQAEKVKIEKGLQQTKLEHIRISLGLSQSALSSISGVSLRAIQQYEQKHRSIDGAKLSSMLDLCIALKCSLEDILEDGSTIVKLNKVLNGENKYENQNLIKSKFAEEKELYNYYFLNNESKTDDIVSQTINSLIPQDWQLMLKMRYEQEMTLSKIAKELGISLSSVQSIINNAVRRLHSLKGAEQ